MLLAMLVLLHVVIVGGVPLAALGTSFDLDGGFNVFLAEIGPEWLVAITIVLSIISMILVLRLITGKQIGLHILREDHYDDSSTKSRSATTDSHRIRPVIVGIRVRRKQF